MRKWIATGLNFFFPGLGYLVLGHKKVQSVLWLAGVIGLTYVELGIKEPVPSLYTAIFVSVLILNTAFAYDAYLVGSEQEG